jgi:hypothetical protein
VGSLDKRELRPLLFIVAVSLLGTTAAVEIGDTWYHLLVGKYIWQFIEIPRFGFLVMNHESTPFVYHEWLSQGIFYAIYHWFGLWGLYMLRAVMSLLLGFILLGLMGKRHGLVLYAIILAVISKPLLTIMVDRPQLFSVVLFSLFLLILVGFRNGQQKTIWWLPLLSVLWVNLHGYFLFGLTLIFLFLISSLIERNWYRAKVLALVLLASALTGLLNPFGYKIYTLPFAVSYSMKFINEWKTPLSLVNLSFQLAFSYLWFVYVIFGASLIVRRHRIENLLLSIFFCGLYFWSFRNIIFLIPIGTYILTQLWEEWGYLISFPRIPRSVVVTIIVVLLGLQSYRLVDIPKASIKYPSDSLITTLKQESNVNLFTDSWDADNVLFRINQEQWHSDIRVLADLRIELYSDDNLTNYYKTIEGTAECIGLLKANQVNWILLEDDKPLLRQALASGEYGLVLKDAGYVLLSRNFIKH